MTIDDFVREMLEGRGIWPELRSEATIRSTPLFSGGLLASVQFLKLLLRVEEEVGQIEDDDLVEENFDTLEAIASLIARYRAKRRIGSSEGPSAV